MKIDQSLIDALNASITKLETFVDRDDDVGRLYDAADRYGPGNEDYERDGARQRQDDEREMRLEEALTACLQAGVNREHLKVLAFECGATHWALQQSLKG